MTPFDPDAPAAPGSGIFGLECTREDARVVLLPVPFAATVSYGAGAERGPEAILAASHQVDLYDFHFGRAYEAGIHLVPPSPDVAAAHDRARSIAAPLVAAGGASPDDPRVVR